MEKKHNNLEKINLKRANMWKAPMSEPKPTDILWVESSESDTHPSSREDKPTILVHLKH